MKVTNQHGTGLDFMANKVGLSYAHYPEAVGASCGDFCEHYESIEWTEIIKKVLEYHGVEVVIAPVGKLGSKVKWLNEQKVDLAIEVHFNGSTNLTVNGCETLYCPNSVKGKELADKVHSWLSPSMHNKNRGVKEGWYRMDKTAGIIDYFLAKTNCPALIIEPEFISQIDNILDRRTVACESISFGILDYLGVSEWQ